MKRLGLAALALVGAGCGVSSSDSSSAQLAHLHYEVPSGWTDAESATARGPSTTWTPEENAHKESLILRRTQLEPGRTEPDLATLRTLVLDAQHLLPEATIGTIEPLMTAGGLRGVVVASTFTPRGQTARYFRKHAVLLDGDAYVQVLYTAQAPNEELLDQVVRSIRKEG